MMKVSIITICRNAEQTIEQTINSVINQTYKDIEYIIIDGKSTDHTLDIIYRYKNRIDKIISEKDMGIYDAMNKGIKNSLGDIIGILNADDWYENNVIEQIVAIFKKQNVEIVHGDIRYVDEDGNTGCMEAENLEKLWFSMAVRHPATFVRREVYRKVGLFDDNLRIAGDYDFILRCYLNNIIFYHYNKILTNFRMTGISHIQVEKCFNETNLVALRYVENSPNKEENYNIIYGRMNRKRFSSLMREELDSVQAGQNFSRLFPKKKVYIWGCGEWGKRLSSFLLRNGIDIIAFLDSDEKKIGNQINGIEIKGLLSSKLSEYPVLVAIAKLDDGMKIEIAKMKQNNFNVVLFEEAMKCILKDNQCYMEFPVNS